MKFKKNKNGFTLIELLVVMAIMGVLFTTIVVAVNPSRQFSKARDSRRESDIFAIMSAVLQYSSEHSGELPDTDGDPDTNNFPTTATCIGTSAECFDLAGAGDTGETIVPVYLAEMLVDPQPEDDECPGDQTNTCYMIWVDENNRLHATATGETRTISVVK